MTFCKTGAAAAALAIAVISAPALLAAPQAPSKSPSSDKSPASEKPVTLEQLIARADEDVENGRIFEAITTLTKAVEAAPGRVDLRVRLAALMKQRGMWVRSAEQYRAAIDIDAGSIPARLGYGELLLAEYQFRAAAAEFRKVLDITPPGNDRDRALVGMGSAQFGLEQYREAVDTYRQILARRPDELTALAFTNIALRKIGDLDAAAEGWRHFLEKRPGMPSATIHLTEIEELRSAIVRQKEAAAASPTDRAAQAKLGDLLVGQPDLDGAAAAYRAALKAGPPDAALRFKLGAVLRDAGRFPEALTEFSALASDRGLGAIAGYNAAYCARRAGDTRAELDAWRSAIDTNPRDRYAYGRYAEALRRSGKAADEAASLLKAIKEKPSDPLPRVRYARLSREAGGDEESVKALLDALTLEPNDPYAQAELRAALATRPELGKRAIEQIGKAGGDPAVADLRRAVVWMATGKNADAEPLLESLAGRRPQDPRILVALAICQRTGGAAIGPVVETLRRARDLDPKYVYAHMDLAMALLSANRFDDAAAEARAALELDHDSPIALTILGAALRGSGDPDSLETARRALRRALEIDPSDSADATRMLLAKVTWEAGDDAGARRALKGDLPVDGEEMYRIAWEFVRDHFKDRGFHGQDWNAWRDRFAGKLETPADALGAIALMLASLDDRDTRLRSADQTAGLFFSMRSTTVQRDSSGRTALGSRTVATSTLTGDVGYVAVTNMADPKMLKDVKEAVGGMKEKEGVILDLRGNPGGAEKDAESIASLFVPEGTKTGTVVTSSGKEAVAAHSEAPPAIPDKPLVVLVDRNTGSSAEALAGALKESKRAVIVGEPTYGKAGIQFPKLLPDGTTVLVAGAENADLAGRAYSGVGITPDVHVDGSSPAADPEQDAAIRKAREILVKGKGRKPAASQPGNPSP